MSSLVHTHATTIRPQTSGQTPGLTVKTHVKAGAADALSQNHNETLVQAARPPVGLTVKTHVKAGGITLNHNETLVQAWRMPALSHTHAPTTRPQTLDQAPALRVHTHIKAGSFPPGPSRA